MSKENYIIYGKRTVREYLAAGAVSADIEIIFSSTGEADPGRGDPKLALPGALGKTVPAERIRALPRRELDRMFPDINHQGIVIRLLPGKTPHDKRDWREFLKEGGLGPLLALDGIQDPRNLGGIIRSAEALGVQALFVTGQGARLTPAADRAAAGASFHLPVCTDLNPNRLLDAARKAGYWIIVADSPDALSPGSAAPLAINSNEMYRLPAAKECLLFIGGEESGVRALVRKKADFIITIPLHGKVASLNASIALGILLDRIVNR